MSRIKTQHQVLQLCDLLFPVISADGERHVAVGKPPHD